MACHALLPNMAERLCDKPKKGLRRRLALHPWDCNKNTEWFLYTSACIVQEIQAGCCRDIFKRHFLFFFRDLEAPGQSLNALLMKFARSSADVTGVKVYNSKKPTWWCFQLKLHCVVNIEVNIEAVQLSKLGILEELKQYLTGILVYWRLWRRVDELIANSFLTYWSHI